MTTRDELLPCPFCGGEAEDKLIETYSLDSSFYVIACKKCGTMQQCQDQNNGIITDYDRCQWNTRALSQAGADASDAARDVLAERQRQKDVEGWTPEHDDEHSNGEMACAAACYALYSARCATRFYQEGEPEYSVDRDTLWPWGFDWWKPKNPRRDLVRAGALILAEIERLDRAQAAQKPAEEKSREAE